MEHNWNTSVGASGGRQWLAYPALSCDFSVLVDGNITLLDELSTNTMCIYITTAYRNIRHL